MHESVARIELTISEMKGACSDDCATEAHVYRVSKNAMEIQQAVVHHQLLHKTKEQLF